MSSFRYLILIAAMLAWTLPVLAQTPATQPTSAPAKPLKAVVKETSGPAQRLVAQAQGDPKWEPLKVGDELGEEEIIRTGFGSKVVLAFQDNSTVVIDRATKMGIGQFRKSGPVTRTAVNLKYGSLEATVDRTRGPNDFTVTTPVATAAVRGSGARIGSTGDFGFRIRSQHGEWRIGMGSSQRTVTGREGTNQQLARWAEVMNERTSVQLGDVSGGLSRRELNNLLNQDSGRGAIGFGPAGTGGAATLPPPPPITSDVHVPGMDDNLGK